jgi:hypothetical protein
MALAIISRLRMHLRSQGITFAHLAYAKRCLGADRAHAHLLKRIEPFFRMGTLLDYQAGSCELAAPMYWLDKAPEQFFDSKWGPTGSGKIRTTVELVIDPLYRPHSSGKFESD